MLGVKDKPVLTLFNKIDKRTDTEPLMDERADRVMKVSAKTGEGFDAWEKWLCEAIEAWNA